MGAIFSSFDRNRELQIQAEERARNPQVIAQQERSDLRRKKELLVGEIEHFLGMWRSRHRSAASGSFEAKAFAEGKISALDSYLFQTFGRVSASSGEQSLLAVAEYVAKVLDPEMAASLQAVCDVARTDIELRNFEARTQRELAWRAEAAKLNAIGVIKALEVNDARLVLQDGKIGIKGALADDRCRLFINAHRAEIYQVLVQREAVVLIEEES